MSRPREIQSLASLAALAVVLSFVSGCTSGGPDAGTSGPAILKVSFRSEPANFNRLVSSKAAEQRITFLTQSTLVRVNPISDELEPRLAASWTPGSDGKTWTLTLRDGLTFSDGVPLTAADVVFTFNALYDERLASVMASAFRIGGQPIAVRALDPKTVTVTFPSVYGPGLRLLDSLPILPAHKLEAAWHEGKLRDVWGPSTPPAEIVGSGPFVISEIHPGQSLRFTRNPHYWARDAQGRALPYLDGVDVQIAPSQDAEILRLESGDVDVTTDFVRPEDFAVLRPLADKGTIQMIEAGIGVDPSALWFDLTPGAAAAKNRPWLQREAFRQAVSLAVDRQAIVDSVYLGAGVPIGGPITPSFGGWYTPEVAVPARDLARAKTLFASAGLTDSKHDGVLRDAAGTPAAFTLITDKGRSDRVRTATLVAAELKDAGLAVDAVPLEQGAVVARIMGAGYDAAYFGAQTTSRDPAENLDFWMSRGGFHFWHPGQTTPATPWEAQIDALTTRQAAMSDLAERQRLFVETQKIFAAHTPLIYLAAPRVTVAVNHRVRGVRASVLQPPVLWNIDSLSIGGSAKQ
jgi:peptide/nickel transport system substrate-binding protein